MGRRDCAPIVLHDATRARPRQVVRLSSSGSRRYSWERVRPELRPDRERTLAGLAPSSAARSLSRVRTKHRAFFRYDRGRGVTSRILMVGLAVGLLCGVSACAATGRRASRSAPSAENCNGDDVLEVANESGWSVDVYAYSGASSGGILIGSVGSGPQTLPLAGTWAERKQVGFVARLNGKEVYPVRFRRRCDRDAR